MRQTRITRLWGRTMLSFSHLALYLSLLNLGLLSITTYQSGWIQEHIWRDVNFVQFTGAIAVVIVVGLVVVSRLHIPAFMASWNKSWWTEENPMRERLDKIEKQLDDNARLLDEIRQQVAHLSSSRPHVVESIRRLNGG